MRDENFNVKTILNNDNVVIYGAGVMGKALKLCLEAPPFNSHVRTFIVNSLKNNPDHIGSTPVISLDCAQEYKHQRVIVALNESNMVSANNDLKKAGFDNVLFMNAAGNEFSRIKMIFMKYHPEISPFPVQIIHGTRDNPRCDLKNIRIYVVKSIYDKVAEGVTPLHDYETEIQAGKALTDQQLCEVTDSDGENISAENRQYCELTALYWVWRHEWSDYIGLSHYRRRFNTNSRILGTVVFDEYDVVVTIPVICTEGVKAQYTAAHPMVQWDAMKNAVKTFEPDYFDDFSIISCAKCFYAYNMLIMKRKILDAYCSWLFPILRECVRNIGIVEDSYQNRYPGFMAEILMNVWIYHNRNKLKCGMISKKYFVKE